MTTSQIELHNLDKPLLTLLQMRNVAIFEAPNRLLLSQVSYHYQHSIH